MVDDLSISSLGHDMDRIDCEVSQLERAMAGPSGRRGASAIARRIEAAARGLSRRLDEESATLWLLLQDPARQCQAHQIQGRSRRIFDRLLSLLGRGQRPSRESIGEKCQAIQSLCRRSAGHATVQGWSADRSGWSAAFASGLEDPWTSVVVLSGVLADVMSVVLVRGDELVS